MPDDTATRDYGDIRIGAVIRALREAEGLEAQELAARIGVSPSLVSYIESGRRNATPPVRKAIAVALGVPLGAIIGPPAEQQKALAAKLGIPVESLREMESVQEAVS